MMTIADDRRVVGIGRKGRVQTCDRIPIGRDKRFLTNAEGGGDAMDNQESFLFAEVLKYAYLVFAEEAEYQVFGGVGAANGWVYNTEAHPFRVYGGSG